MHGHACPRNVTEFSTGSLDGYADAQVYGWAVRTFFLWHDGAVPLDPWDRYLQFSEEPVLGEATVSALLAPRSVSAIELVHAHLLTRSNDALVANECLHL